MDERTQSLDALTQQLGVLWRLVSAARPIDGLDRSAIVILSELEEQKATPIGLLAEELKLDVSTASRQVAALEAKGYVTRQRDDRDGRVILACITEAGRQASHDVQEARRRIYKHVLHRWSDDELATLSSNLTRLVNDLKEWKQTR